MKENNILLEIILIIHAIFWVGLFCCIVFFDLYEFHLLYTLPIIYLSYVIFNDCLFELIETKKQTKKKTQ
jgi:hypothetical protein